MGIRFLCPNGHKLNVKAFLAGRRGICPFCGAKFEIPTESTLQPSQSSPPGSPPLDADAPIVPVAAGAAFEDDLETHVEQGEQTDVKPNPWSGQPTSSNGPDELPNTADEDSHSVPTGTTEPEAEAAENAYADDSPDIGENRSVSTPISVSPPQSSSTPDPLAETPNAVWYVRPPSGGQFGPAQADMMRGWLTEGRVSPETLVWREGWADWQEAGSVFPELQSPSASPAAPPVAVTEGSTSSYRTGPRRRKKGAKMGVIVALAAIVLLLLVVLIWISAGDNEDNSSETNSADVSLTWHPAAQAALTTQIPS